jgi:uncharacterized protein
MFLYNAHEGKNKWFHYLSTLLLVIVGYVGGSMPYAIIATLFANKSGLPVDDAKAAVEKMDLGAIGMDLNVGLMLLILIFAFTLLALWVGVTKVHGKKFSSIVSTRKPLDWERIFFAFGVWFGLSTLVEIMVYFSDPSLYTWQFEPSKFFPLVLISVFLLPIQTSTEEFLCRGYLMQGISLFSKYRWMPLVMTACIFGSLHGSNPEVVQFGVAKMMTYYIGTGLFLGMLALMDDGLELPLGIHAANNVYGSLAVSFSGSVLQTPALFKLKEMNVNLMIIGFFSIAAITWWIFSRKYGWNDWSKVVGEVQRNVAASEIEDDFVNI